MLCFNPSPWGPVSTAYPRHRLCRRHWPDLPCADPSRYLGSSPFDSPGTYTLLQWTEICEGIVRRSHLPSPCSLSPHIQLSAIAAAKSKQWYPKGGFARVPQSFQAIAESHGAKFHFNAPIQSVTYGNLNRATGVRLGNGDFVEADIVVVNADLVWAHNNLFVKDGEEHTKSGGGRKDVKGQRGGELLDPKLAKKLLGKPHS